VPEKNNGPFNIEITSFNILWCCLAL